MQRPPSTTSEAAVDHSEQHGRGAVGTVDEGDGDDEERDAEPQGGDEDDGDQHTLTSGWARSRVRGSVAMMPRGRWSGGAADGDDMDDEEMEHGDAMGGEMGRRAVAAARGSVDSVSTAQLDAEWESWQAIGRAVQQGAGGGGGHGPMTAVAAEAAGLPKTAAVWASIWK